MRDASKLQHTYNYNTTTTQADEISTRKSVFPTTFFPHRFMTFYDTLHAYNNFRTKMWILKNRGPSYVFLGARLKWKAAPRYTGLLLAAISPEQSPSRTIPLHPHVEHRQKLIALAVAEALCVGSCPCIPRLSNAEAQGRAREI